MTKIDEGATQKQVEYATVIHELLGADLPTEKTKSAYIKYLNRYAPIYRARCGEYRLTSEMQNEMIDARRDW